MPKSEDGFAAASSSTPTISESPLGGVPHQAGLQCLDSDRFHRDLPWYCDHVVASSIPFLYPVVMRFS